MQHVAGIDIGAGSSKAVIVANGKLLSRHIIPSGGNYKMAAEVVLDAALKKAELSRGDIACIVATGGGAVNVACADKTSSDILCQGRAVSRFHPSVRTIVDVGDLSSKVSRIDQSGKTVAFLLSGKCAGGSARILQVIARVLQVKIEEIGPLSLTSQNPVRFNTQCAVFAETEAVSRIAEGLAKEDLLAGIHLALAAQLYTLAERIGIEQDCALIGGGAKDMGLIKAIQEIAGHEFIVPLEPQIMAAYGAAIIAEENVA
ncbi:MAG: acyl-CoA dehydratase activase [Syntrophales bacterium]|jgi:predicted CoA-substrate-specific enzyme activase|nr:acyl-CoA dehydratase activase [Syntrophales bacterium]